MKILVSNDDGIDSRGIFELSQKLKEIGEVIVVAPRTEQSAVGHAITMKIPVRVTEYYRNGEFFGYAVDGTPADCIKMGIKNIMGELPDLVVSGINNGSNAAINIIYSGTVSAAREAAIMDVPAIAVSVTSHTVTEFDYAAEIAKNLALKVAENGLRAGTLLNVNIPDLPKDKIKGVLLTRQGLSKWDDKFEERKDPYGKKYYWLTGSLIDNDLELGTDHYALKNDYVSVTPIHFDLTDYEMFGKMKDWNISG
ncbi:MAG: 5'/3'-nucleotidase SurE [Melioribacteraceae bacterium]|nr:5'/3'-nucleotidase SurE [Melioribacteraceae bacterium]